MRRSGERILTTHTGSLPRPSDLVATLRGGGPGTDDGDARGRVREAMRAVVER